VDLWVYIDHKITENGTGADKEDEGENGLLRINVIWTRMCRMMLLVSSNV